ncbi:sporulation protein [Actinocorallia aurea]
MIFKRLAGVFGVGGPSVETVLASSITRPGEFVTGEVRVVGGDHDVDIQGVYVGLVTRVETEDGDEEGTVVHEFNRGAIAGPFPLPAGQHHRFPFRLPVPWELPVTEVHGRHLPGMAVGVRTELEVAGARDKGDLDPLAVHALPSQQRILDAFGALGFQFKSADLEAGHISGVHQELPFYQEIEFYPPPRYQGRINEVELTFVAGPHHLDVILEADRAAGIFGEGADAFGRFRTEHEQALHVPWEAEVTRWLEAVAAHAHGDDHEHGHHGGHEHHNGPGWGSVAAAGAVGLAGGAAAALAVDALLDDEDEEEELEEAIEDAAEQARFDAAVDAAYANAYEEAYEEAEEAYED